MIGDIFEYGQDNLYLFEIEFMSKKILLYLKKLSIEQLDYLEENKEYLIRNPHKFFEIMKKNIFLVPELEIEDTAKLFSEETESLLDSIIYGIRLKFSLENHLSDILDKIYKKEQNKKELTEYFKKILIKKFNYKVFDFKDLKEKDFLDLIIEESYYNLELEDFLVFLREEVLKVIYGEPENIKKKLTKKTINILDNLININKKEQKISKEDEIALEKLAAFNSLQNL